MILHVRICLGTHSQLSHIHILLDDVKHVLTINDRPSRVPMVVEPENKHDSGWAGRPYNASNGVILKQNGRRMGKRESKERDEERKKKRKKKGNKKTLISVS